ncbi:iron-sulfur cluster insertion protein ErpA [Candidatus Zinderia endosymbiont of Aphrophora alni]|uniref:iron-sulfur cluster insertion protein ErpA n=1 Tax=Candidatus Zinderia endosymbiont of Aphrophora alni TaxID=3077951 RepID=UPI0030CED286
MIFIIKNKKLKITPSNISLTNKAILRIKSIIKKKKELKLRIFIKGGGCSGFKYGFILEKLVNFDDIIIILNDIQLLVDFISYQYLIGSKIDYYDDINGSKFIVNNPNAITTCGCGSSFSI